MFSDERCHDVAACEESCNAGKGKGCKELALSLIMGKTGGDEATNVDKNIPRGLELLSKSCKLGDVRGCAALSSMLLYAKRYDEAMKLAEKACNVGRDEDACTNIADILAAKGDQKGAAKAYEKACLMTDATTQSRACTERKKAAGIE